MKTKFSKFLLAMFIALPSLLFSQNYPLQVILTPSSNFTSYFGELKENPGRYMQVRVINNSGASRNVYFQMRIERLYPSTDISVYSNIEKKPDLPIPIAIGSNSMRMDQLDDNFATHQYEDFAVSGIEVNSVDDLMGSFRIPEGQYKLCLIAYDYDTPIGSEPVMLSDPNFSCAQVKICYSASKIELISPVNTMIAGNSSNVVIQPKRNLLVQWTQPSTTCGASMGNVDYELKFTDIYDGQTEEDALNYNPILLSLSYKNKTSVMLDTMQYQGIFNNGKRYAIGVTATASNQDIAILNDGKTTPASFIYGELPPNKGQQNTVKSKPSITNVPDCGNAVPDNKELIATLNINDIIHVGNYDMKLTNVYKNDDGSFKGKGTIDLASNHLFNGFPQIKAKVEFDKLQVNTGNQVIDGIVRTVYDDDDKQKFFSGFGNDLSWDNKYLSKDDDKVLTENAKEIAQDFINSAMPKVGAEVNFPIKVESKGIEVAVSGMSFGAKGATFSMLYFMKISEGNKILAFGAKNICTNNNNVDNAKFFLIKDIKTKIEGLDFAIVGGEDKTYVKWNNKGYQGIKLSAKISIPNSVIIDKEGKNIDNLELGAEFNSWSNWEAKITIPDFKLAFCQDLSFDGLEARYVHKIGADGTVNKGIIFPNLKMNLPDYIKGLDGIIVESASILSGGFNLSLEKTGILPINSGRIGGWGFSIDELKFNIVDNIFKTGKIAGKIRIPFFEKEIAYGGSPTALENALNLGITVNIGNGTTTNFLNYFSATLDEVSNISIDNKGKISTNLKGKISALKDTEFGFNAKFNGLKIANYKGDEIGTLDFSVESWEMDGEEGVGWNGFGVTIKRMDVVISDNILKFGFNADLKLGEKNICISGSCQPSLLFTINNSEKRVTKIAFDLPKVHVSGTFTEALELDGYLNRFDNEKMGKGIDGDIECKFPLGINVMSSVCFGNKIVNDKKVKYFYADAALKLPPENGIPIGGVISIYGFGGAFWWNMQMQKPSDNESVSDLNKIEDAPEGKATRSGIKLEPYGGEGKALGFAADVYLCSTVGGPYMFNGQAGLGVNFNNGQLQEINLNGKIRVIGDGSDNDGNYVVTGGVSMAISKQYFKLDAKLEAKLLAATAIIPLHIDANFEKKEYGFSLGTPYYRDSCASDGGTWCIGFNMDVPMVKINSSLQGYFCAGNSIIHPMPPLPQELLDLLGEGKVNRGAIATNKKGSPGIMFGTRFHLDFTFTFGPLEAKFITYLGFDIEMKQLRGQRCGDGREITGINGYYCRGQLYAYIKGAVNVVLKFFGKRRSFELCSIEAGALLRGGFPDPTWFKGAVAVKGSILDGLISFNTSTRFTVGSPCKDPSGELDITIIDEISPGFRKMDDASNQGLDDRPSIYTGCAISTYVPMNIPVNLLSLTDDESQKMETYLFIFESVTLRNLSGDRPSTVPLNNQYLDQMLSKQPSKRISGKQFMVLPDGVLEPYSMHELTIVSKVLEKNKDGNFDTPKGVSPKAATITDKVYFMTGKLPNTIEENNIVTGYPAKRQFETFEYNGQDTLCYLVLRNDIDDIINKRDKSVGKFGLIGEYKNLSRDQKPIIFLYKYENEGHNRIGGVAKVSYQLKGYHHPGSELPGSLIKGDIYEMNLYIVEEAAKNTKYTKVKVDTTIAREIRPVDTTGIRDIENNNVTVVDVDKNLGGIKTSEGKHTGKVYEAIRGEQDARTNPLDGILRDGMSKGREIINQASIANKGSQITNQGNIVGGLSQGSVAGGVGIGNQAMNQGQVTTYSNTGGSTTKSKAMPAIPSNPNMSSNVASNNGKIKAPAGMFASSMQSTQSIQKANGNSKIDIFVNDNSVPRTPVVPETVSDLDVANYNDYKDLETVTNISTIDASGNVRSGQVSTKFIEAVKGKLEKSKTVNKAEDIYQNAKLKHIFRNYFRMSKYRSMDSKINAAKVKAFYPSGWTLDDSRPILSEATISSHYDAHRNEKDLKMWRPSQAFVEIEFPSFTTVDEVFGGRAFDNPSGYEIPPRIQCAPEIIRDNRGEMGYEWNVACKPFLSEIRKVSDHFILPYTKNEELTWDGLLKHNIVRYFHPSYTNNQLQGRLTYDEITTGKINRDSETNSDFSFFYHQNDLISQHFAYAMAVGYRMWEGKYLHHPHLYEYTDVGKRLILEFNQPIYYSGKRSYRNNGECMKSFTVTNDLVKSDDTRGGTIILLREKLWCKPEVLNELRNQVISVYGKLTYDTKFGIHETGNVNTFAWHYNKDTEKITYRTMTCNEWFPVSHLCKLLYFDEMFQKSNKVGTYRIDFRLINRGQPGNNKKVYVSTEKVIE